MAWNYKKKENQEKVRWLFDSQGKPIAFVNVDKDKVYSYEGYFVGYLNGELVLNGGYVGEVVYRDYIFKRLSEERNKPIAFGGKLREVPIPPSYKEPLLYLPIDFEDISLSRGNV